MPIFIVDSASLGIPASGPINPDPDPSLPPPIVLPPTSGGAITAPNVLTPKPINAPPYPLSNARILYDNLFDNAITNIVAGQGLTNPNTFERWVVAGAVQIMTVIADDNKSIDSIAIGAHNLGSMGATIQVLTAATEGGAFTSRGIITPTTDKSILILLNAQISVKIIRLVVTNGDGSEIGVLYAGVSLAMERPIFGGHAPIYLNAETTYSNNASETGNWLGRTIVRNGYSTSYKWQFLNDEWYRDNFEPFVVIARKKPFFIAWRPDIYPDEVAYCWLTGDPKPTNRGGGTKFMEVSIEVQGYADR